MFARHFGPTPTNWFPRTHKNSDDHRLAALNKLIAPADVRLNGNREFDPVIRDHRALDQILRRGTLGAGEAYMRGWWDVDALDKCVYRLLRASVDDRLSHAGKAALLIRAWLSNPQTPSRAFANGAAHYDRGNELFAAMLDKRMVYSCAYWDKVDNLDAAQEKKLDLICRKLDLKPGQRLLDIGCGWGSLCQFAAERYGVECTGITVSEEQLALARKRTAGLPIEIRLQDYRDLDEKFDHIASVGMVEHVGEKNYRELFRVVRRCLRPGGLFLLHSIGTNVSERATDPWIERYIFPAGQLPSLRRLTTALEDLFVIEDIHNFGAYYDRTLMAWYQNFERNWPDLKSRYDETFFRMWKYYLLTCAGAFRARTLQLWQLVLSPNGVPGGFSNYGR
ncbi:MAG TPA: cyclopropane fatty acyl phospholipid synthase [Woeseiaceae bacterium]|nr:cyclopropane fatty acyl phospholipid synthase [Woeseiaceae bacterium]